MKSGAILGATTGIIVLVLLFVFLPSKSDNQSVLIESTELSASVKNIATQLAKLNQIIEKGETRGLTVADVRKELQKMDHGDIASELTEIRSILGTLQERMSSINSALGGTDGNLQDLTKQLTDLARSMTDITVVGAGENPASARRREAVKTFVQQQCRDLNKLKASMEPFTQRLSSTSPGFYVASYSTNDFVSKDIRASGLWDGAKTRIVQNLLKSLGGEKVTTMDIGANVGWFTLVMASMGHKVIAFEPMASNWQLVTYSVCLNPGMPERVWLYPYGAHERNQVCGIFSEDINKGDGVSVCNDTGNTWFNSDQEDTHLHDGRWYNKQGTIEMVRIDEHVKEDIFLVKLDIEGFELFALKGLPKLLLNYNVKYMIAEFAPSLMKLTGVNPMEVLNWYHDNGFVIRTKNFDSTVLTPAGFQQLIDSWSGRFRDLYLTQNGFSSGTQPTNQQM